MKHFSVRMSLCVPGMACIPNSFADLSFMPIIGKRVLFVSIKVRFIMLCQREMALYFTGICQCSTFGIRQQSFSVNCFPNIIPSLVTPKIFSIPQLLTVTCMKKNLSERQWQCSHLIMSTRAIWNHCNAFFLTRLSYFQMFKLFLLKK